MRSYASLFVPWFDFHSPDTAGGSNCDPFSHVVVILTKELTKEQCETGYKAKSQLLGKPEAVSGSWRDLSPQRLRDSPRLIRTSASIEPAPEPESRSRQNHAFTSA